MLEADLVHEGVEYIAESEKVIKKRLTDLGNLDPYHPRLYSAPSFS